MGLIQSVKQAFFPEMVAIKGIIENLASKSAFSNAFAKGSPLYEMIMSHGSSVNNPYKQSPNVYKAVKAICDNAAQAEYAIKGWNSEKEANDQELERLLEEPNPLMTFQDFIQAVVGFSALYDEYFIIKEYGTRDPNGKELPLELWPFHPKHFMEEYENIGGNIKRLIGWRYTPSQRVYRLDEVIHGKGFNPDSLFRGLAPTDVIKNEIEIAWQSMIFNKSFFKNGATPSLVFSSPNAISDTQSKQIKEWIDREYKGATEAFKTILLQSGLKAEHLAHTHTEMEFTEQSKYMREEILGVFRVPKSMFSITDDMNYATSREQSRIMWEDTILPIMKKIYNSINIRMVKPYNKNIYIEPDVMNIPAFKAVFSEKLDQAVKMYGLKIPLNDIIKTLQLPLPSYAWGDTVFVSFSDAPIESVISGETRQSNSAEDPKKAITTKEEPVKEINTKATQARMMFLKAHGLIEKSIEGKISRFFYEQRIKALKAVQKSVPNYTTKKFEGEDLLDWDEENRILISKLIPYITGAYKAGVDYAEQFGLQARNIEVLRAKITGLIQEQTRKITYINRTTRERLEKNISEALANGVQSGLSATQMQEAVIESVKDIYNITSKRALLISRTETTGAMNGGSVAYYKESGIRYKEWLSAEDEHVRDSHKNVGIVSIESKFKNGLMFPGDPSADIAETANCRCSVAPVIKK